MYDSKTLETFLEETCCGSGDAVCEFCCKLIERVTTWQGALFPDSGLPYLHNYLWVTKDEAAQFSLNVGELGFCEFLHPTDGRTYRIEFDAGPLAAGTESSLVRLRVSKWIPAETPAAIESSNEELKRRIWQNNVIQNT